MFYLTLFLLLFAFAKQANAECDEEIEYSLPGLDTKNFSFYGTDLSYDKASCMLVSHLFDAKEENPLTEIIQKTIGQMNIAEIEFANERAKALEAQLIVQEDELQTLARLGKMNAQKVAQGEQEDSEDKGDDPFNESFSYQIMWSPDMGEMPPVPNGVGSWVDVGDGKYIYDPDYKATKWATAKSLLSSAKSACTWLKSAWGL